MPLTTSDDKVWFDEARKLEQICDHTSESVRNGRSILLLSHFESIVASLATMLHARGVRHEQFSSLSTASFCASPAGTVWLSRAQTLAAANWMTGSAVRSNLEIIVAEHHPMHSRDHEIADAAGKLSCDVELVFYFSLDDPLMKHFGSDGTRVLFERLGIDKDECISHHLVNTAIRTAQEKIEDRVGRDVPAYSAADWFKYNLPQKN